MFRNLIKNRQFFRYPLLRCSTQGSANELTAGEKKLAEVLKDKFPGSKEIQVSDISGGCGAMYEINIEAEEFRGKRTVQQHMMVNEALKKEIKEMHGLRINTSVPS